MAPTGGGTEPRQADPRRVAEVVLAAAVRASCDAVFIEPMIGSDEVYAISFERERQTLSTLSVTALVGTATIARLAYLARLDLAAQHVTSAIIPVRSGDRSAE